MLGKVFVVLFFWSVFVAQWGRVGGDAAPAAAGAVTSVLHLPVFSPGAGGSGEKAGECPETSVTNGVFGSAPQLVTCVFVGDTVVVDPCPPAARKLECSLRGRRWPFLMTVFGVVYSVSSGVATTARRRVGAFVLFPYVWNSAWGGGCDARGVPP